MQEDAQRKVFCLFTKPDEVLGLFGNEVVVGYEQLQVVGLAEEA